MARLRVLFAADPSKWESYADPLGRAFLAEGLDIDLSQKHAPDEVDYIVYAPNDALRDFGRFPRLKAVLNLWAGVEDVVGNDTLRVPLARMVDPGLTEGMVEYVTAHVLRHHMGTDNHVLNQEGVWRQSVPPLARHRRVGVLGLGELGAACAKALAALNFDIAGWSRRARTIPGVTTWHGAEGFDRILAHCEIAVLLLPLTSETEGIIDAAALARLPPNAVVINPGRGRLIDDAALLAALETGHLSHATLDTFRIEPLPQDHPFWAHPGVTVTPHIASATRPETAAVAVAQNIARAEAGETLHHLVDRDAGY